MHSVFWYSFPTIMCRQVWNAYFFLVMDIWSGFHFVGNSESGVVPETHLDWEVRESMGKEGPCPKNKCRLDKNAWARAGLEKGSTISSKLKQKTRSFHVGLLTEGLIKEIKIKHSREVLVLPSCPTLCDPMDCSRPGSPVHGILQARILGCVAINWKQNLVSAVRVPRHGKGTNWREFGEGSLLAEQSWGVWGSGTVEGREGGREASCKEECSSPVLPASYSHFSCGSEGLLLRIADSQVLQAGTLPLSSRFICWAAFSSSMSNRYFIFSILI